MLPRSLIGVLMRLCSFALRAAIVIRELSLTTQYLTEELRHAFGDARVFGGKEVLLNGPTS